MRIIYLANHNNKFSDDTEGHISKALEEMGHEVVKTANPFMFPEGDMLLFHKIIPKKSFKGKKVCWYFDKVWKNRPEEIKKTLKRADYLFMTDKTWAMKHPNEKIHILRQGVGKKTRGVPSKAPKLAFTGSIYGERAQWVSELKKRFKNDFAVYNNKFGKDLADLCASTKIFIAPPFPGDNEYWSNRMYEITGRGGFLLHPQCNADIDVPMYKDFHDMLFKINFYLENEEERFAIQENCYQQCPTYKNKVEELMSIVWK